MRIRVNSSSSTGGGEVLVPGDPVPPVDLEDLFVVDTFETDETEAPPFTTVKVSWTIEPKDAETRFEDFEFRLIAPPQFIVSEITADGEHAFTLLRTTSLRLQGRRNGSPWMLLGPSITVSVDESDCRLIHLHGNGIDAEVFEELEKVTSDTAELRLRSVPLSTDPEDPDAPLKWEQLQPESEWDSERIRYYFPLEIVTPYFFNGDVDVWAEVGFVVTHDEDENEDGAGTDVDIRLEFDIDVDYASLEYLFCGAVAEKAIEALLPLILECQKRRIEEMLAKRLLANELMEDALETGRFFDIRIVPRGPRSVINHVEIVICEEPPEPEGPSGGVVTQ